MQRTWRIHQTSILIPSASGERRERERKEKARAVWEIGFYGSDIETLKAWHVHEGSMQGLRMTLESLFLSLSTTKNHLNAVVVSNWDYSFQAVFCFFVKIHWDWGGGASLQIKQTSIRTELFAILRLCNITGRERLIWTRLIRSST